MAALVASSVGGEWEMVYMVSWVAMPTMAALVVMLARWKGKKPTPSAPPPGFPLKSYPPEEASQMGSEDSSPKHCRKHKGKLQRREQQNIVRRVTSCPDFAVVQVVKTGVKNGRQLSYADLRLQEEIARLADKLLERRCDWEQGCRCKCGDDFGCDIRGEKVGSCGFDRAHECDCIGSACEQMDAKGFSQGGSLSARGKKACAALEALLAEKAAALQRKHAENFETKGNPSTRPEVVDSVLGGPMQGVAAPPKTRFVGGREYVKENIVAPGAADRLGYYNQLRPKPSKLVNALCSVGCQSGELRRLLESSVVRFWSSEQGGRGVNETKLEQMEFEPGVNGRGVSKTSIGLWSVTFNGVVESWDSRVGKAPLFRHVLPLQQRGGFDVGGLNVTGSQLRVLLTSGGAVFLDERKCLKVLE